MRFTSIQLFVAMLTFTCLQANTNAQEILNHRVSLDAQKVQLKKVLNNIEQQANVNFTYSSQKIAVKQSVSINVNDERLEKVLEQLFAPVSIDYKVFNDRTIVLTKNNPTGSVDIENDDPLVATIRGTVSDGENGDPLIGASVAIKGTLIGTITDVDGSFELSTSRDLPITLEISYTGYITQDVTVSDATAEVNVVLTSGVNLESITVVGSRGKPRTDLDSPVPVDAIQASDLFKTGQPDIAQSIHFTVPSFSAQKFGINDLAPLIDPAQLRGLGSDQTLLTVNGKRRHKVAFFNGNDGVGKGQLGNDINSIPSMAVERVEVLRDGAAAQYGSDAIAGVVNMQLKNNRSGGSFMAYLGSTNTSPEYDDVTNAGEEGEKIYGDDAITDGNTFSTGLNFGLPWGKDGFISTTLQYSHADATDRSGAYRHSSGWYTVGQLTSVFGEDAVNALDTDGDGSVSNSEKAPLDQQLQAQNGINPDRAVLGTAENTNGGLFINAGKAINDIWEYYGMAGFTKKHIVGGVFTRTPARSDRAVTEIFFNGYNPEVPSTLTDWQALSGFKLALLK